MLSTNTLSKELTMSRQILRLPALGTIAGPVLFTVVWVVLGFLSPAYTTWGT